MERPDMNKTLALLTLFSATGMALSLATAPGMADDPAVPGIVIAADEKPAPAAPAQDPTDPILAPKTYPTTPAEVAECMKTWDPATQMSREEYEKSCQQTLKYFPEKPE
jgi:hypothetical protein